MIPTFHETRPCGILYLSITHSARSSRRNPRFDGAMDQTLRPFDKGQMVGEAALKQHADAMVARNIGGGNQGDVFRRA